MALAWSIDEPRRIALTHKIERKTLRSDELAGNASAPVYPEVREALLQGTEDEHEMGHEGSNNLLSDKDVAISNITGYCAKIRVRNCPCPPLPLPSSRRTGVS